MIFDEIHTSFPFYDDILKQNRHKKNCENQCNYRLIFPYNTIIPFQFAIPQKDPSDYAVIDSCYVKCSDDDSIILDLVAFLNGSFDTINTLFDTINTLTDNKYIGVWSVPIQGLTIPCGNYYIEITISNVDVGTLTYYSEEFEIRQDLPQSLLSNTFTQTDPFNFTPFRFSVKEQLLNHNLRHCKNNCDYTLISGNDALIPFQFRIPTGAVAVQQFYLLSDDESCRFDIDYNLINVSSVGLYDYVTFFDDIGTTLPCGTFICYVVIDGITYSSEKIKIINEIDTIGQGFYLLQENAFKILQESGFGVLLE